MYKGLRILMVIYLVRAWIRAFNQEAKLNDKIWNVEKHTMECQKQYGTVMATS